MKDDKKEAAMIILSKLKDKKKDGKEEEKEYEGLDAASEEILSAISSEDSKKLKKALKSFIELCQEEE